MTLGIPKKYERVVLVVLGLGLAYEFYDNVIAGPSIPTPSKTASKTIPTSDETAGTSPSVATPGSTPGASTQPPRVPGRAGRNDSFVPVYVSKRPEDRIPVNKIDPTLHLEKLAKLQDVPPAGSGRDLFNWGAAPPPAPVKLAGSEPVVKPRPVGPPVPPPPAPKAVPPPPPPPPPINLKYYGIATRLDNGRKTAFFMDGEEILVQAEGSTFGGSGRYKLLKIGVNSALVEDTQYKRQQTLPLEEGPPPGS